MSVPVDSAHGRGVWSDPLRGGRPALYMLMVIALTWPAWINGGPLLFFDSPGYIIQGQTAVEGVLASLRTPDPESGFATPAAGSSTTGSQENFEAAAASARFIRSLGYSGFAYLSYLSPFQAFGIILAQSAIVVGVLSLFVNRALLSRPAAAALAALACVALTPLPWFVSYLMPDVLAAIPILVGMILVRGIQHHGWFAYVFLLTVSVFAVLSHYGHLPLSLGVGLVVTGVLALQKRLALPAIFLAFAPAILASGINMLGSQVAFREASVVPKRMPLLLARSIADGPALWHLQKHCPTYGYTICELFETIPNNLQILLWSDDGLLQGATSEQTERIRDEEFVILARSFMDYPLRQTWSLTGNALTQLVLVGTDDFRWGNLDEDPNTGRLIALREGREALDVFGGVHAASTLLATCFIAFYFWKDRLAVGLREREILLVTVLGILGNAVIFGGLSAPVDRYQSRVVWIIPVLAALFWLTRQCSASGSDPRS